MSEQEFKNKKGTDNEVGNTDEIGVDMIKEQVSNLYDELNTYLESVKNTKDKMSTYEHQWSIDDELYRLQLEDFGLKDEHKTHKVHDNPRYWELLKQNMDYKYRHDKARAEQMIEGFKQDIKTNEDYIENIKSQLNKKFEKLKELGVEVPEDPFGNYPVKKD